MNTADEKSSRAMSKKRQLWSVLLIICGLVGIGAVCWLQMRQFNPPAPGTRQVDAAPAPSATKPAKQTVASYSVAPSLPKYLNIPTIGVTNTRVIQLGLLKNNEIATPDNIYDTGWYTGSSKPGQQGAMFVYGHVSNWQANGVFYNLKKLKAGDILTVTRGDDKIFTYQVVTTKVYAYDKVDMQQVLTPVDKATPGLNLMTCTGQVIKGTSEFNERLVVFTKQLNE